MGSAAGRKFLALRYYGQRAVFPSLRALFHYNRGPDRPRTNWRGLVKKDLEKMGLTGEEGQSAALQNGVGVWPSVSTWARD